jgi:hypothetical protein
LGSSGAEDEPHCVGEKKLASIENYHVDLHHAKS